MNAYLALLTNKVRMMIDIDRLKTIDKSWYAIKDRILISRYTSPLNRIEERSKVEAAFLESKPYNPQFVYREAPSWPVAEIYSFIRGLKPEGSLVEQFYFCEALQVLRTIRSVMTRSPQIITANTCISYGLPDSKLVKTARQILKGDQVVADRDDKSPNLDIEEALTIFRNALQKVGIEGWRVVVEQHMNARVLVSTSRKQIQLRSDAVLSKQAIQRLMLHEVGTHILRYHNGSKQFLQVFSRGLPGYSSTEEGLAVYNEKRYGLLSESALRKYASRVVAASLALNHSFWEIFVELAVYIGWEEAFEVTVRTKRGFTDTSAHGVHLKDIIYLSGWVKIRQHLQTFPEDYQLLYIGKIGLEHLDLVREWLGQELLVEPDFLLTDFAVNTIMP